MSFRKLALALVSSAVLSAAAPLVSQGLNSNFARDPAQPIDQQYTDLIHKYTTDPSFTSPLVDYLPASKTVPTPAKVLGDVSGAPDMLPYAEDVYKYFRLLESSSPRVRVFTIGHSEEGREMIAAAIADPELLAGAKANNERLAKLADPRTSASMTRQPASSSISRTLSTTSPAPSTPRRPARPRPSWSWPIASPSTIRPTSSSSART